MITKHASTSASLASIALIIVATAAALVEAGIGASLMLSAIILFTCLWIASRSRIPLSWIAAALILKTLYAGDILLAVFDGRPLRYAPEVGAQAAEIRAQCLLMLCIWALSFLTAASHLARSYSGLAINLDQKPSPKAIPILLILLSQIAFAAIVNQVGGLSTMLANMSSRYEIYFGIGFLRVIVGFGAVGCAIYYLSGRKRLAWIISVLIFAELAMLGGRSFALFSTIAPIAMLWLAERKSIPIARTAMMAALGITFVSALGTYRSSQLSQQYHTATGVFLKLVLDTGAADNFPSLLSLLRRDATPYAGAEIVASSLFSAIPRAVWKDKPMTDEAAAVGTVLANAGTVNWGLPIGPHGLAFYTGGAILVPLFGLIAGTFFSFVLRMSERNLAWASISPFLALLAPDVISPSTSARALVLMAVAISLSIALRVRLKR